MGILAQSGVSFRATVHLAYRLSTSIFEKGHNILKKSVSKEIAFDLSDISVRIVFHSDSNTRMNYFSTFIFNF